MLGAPRYLVISPKNGVLNLDAIALARASVWLAILVIVGYALGN